MTMGRQIIFSCKKVTHFSFIYEKANKTDRLQPSGGNKTACIENHCIQISSVNEAELSNTNTRVVYIDIFTVVLSCRALYTVNHMTP